MPILVAGCVALPVNQRDAKRIDALSAQASVAAQARLQAQRAEQLAWDAGYFDYAPYWGVSVVPYGGYGWSRGASECYGGVGVGF